MKIAKNEVLRPDIIWVCASMARRNILHMRMGARGGHTTYSRYGTADIDNDGTASVIMIVIMAILMYIGLCKFYPD